MALPPAQAFPDEGRLRSYEEFRETMDMMRPIRFKGVSDLKKFIDSLEECVQYVITTSRFPPWGEGWEKTPYHIYEFYIWTRLREAA